MAGGHAADVAARLYSLGSGRSEAVFSRTPVTRRAAAQYGAVECRRGAGTRTIFTACESAFVITATDLAVVPTVRVTTGSARCRPAGVMLEAPPVDLQFGWEGLILRSCAVDPEMSSMRHYKR